MHSLRQLSTVGIPLRTFMKEDTIPFTVFLHYDDWFETKNETDNCLIYWVVMPLGLSGNKQRKKATVQVWLTLRLENVLTRVVNEDLM